MLLRVKVAAHQLKGREKTLVSSRGFEATHPPFSHLCQSMRILDAVVQTLMLPEFEAFEHFSFGCFVAFQFVGHDDPRHKACRLEQFAKELLIHSFVTIALNQDIKDLPFDIHCPPYVALLALDGDHDLIEMLFTCGFRATATNLIHVDLSKFFAPLANGCVGHLNAPIDHHFLDIAVVQRKGVVESDTVTNNRNWKLVIFVADTHGLALPFSARAYQES